LAGTALSVPAAWLSDDETVVAGMDPCHEEACNAQLLGTTGILGAIYRLLGEGLNNDDIAVRLNLTEVKVKGCIAWIVHFLKSKNRQELVQYASVAA